MISHIHRHHFSSFCKITAPSPRYQFHHRIKKKLNKKIMTCVLPFQKHPPPHVFRRGRVCLVFLISVLNTIEQSLFVHMARLIILSDVFKACLTKIQWYNWPGLRLTITISIRQFHILSSTRPRTHRLYIKKKVIFAKQTENISLRLHVRVARLRSGCCGVICYGMRIMWLSTGVSSQGQTKQGNIIERRTGFELLRW